MNISIIIFWSFVIFLIIYSLGHEYTSGTSSYESGIPIEGDSFPCLLRKINMIIQSRFNSVKWRKVILVTFTIMGLIFYFVDRNFPINDPKKVITYFAILFIPLYALFLYDNGTEMKTLSNSSTKWLELMREKYISKKIFT
jgi:hypothetical protein